MNENYFVYSIENKTFDGTKVRALVELENQYPYGFPTHGDAVSWIRENGYRQVDYVVLQVFRKP